MSIITKFLDRLDELAARAQGIEGYKCDHGQVTINGKPMTLIGPIMLPEDDVSALGEVLKHFQEGDANRLDMLSIVVGAWVNVEKSKNSPKYEQWAEIEDMIFRLREAAKRMEE